MREDTTMKAMLTAGTVLMAAVLGATALGCGAADAKAPNSPSSSPAGYGQPQAEMDVSSTGTTTAGVQEAPPPPASPSVGAAPREAAKKEAAPEPGARPGLGTEWGETRNSRISTVPFVRADASTPFATTSLFYNDETGARAMANASGFRRTGAGAFGAASGTITVGLRDQNGSFMSGFVAGDKNYVVGEAGSRYSIVVKNRTNVRFECIISVDGLDVLDGKAASFAKRGYLLDPNSELEVDGFRQSMDTVAAFRFGSVRDSYANQKHGDTRNVGVIGFALFHERGSNPFPWTSDEVQRRKDANPFPGQFATPPGQ